MFAIKQKTVITLTIITIIGVAFLLRIWDIDSRDLIGDEAAYAFRSVGYIDYLGTSFQTQPIEWFKNSELPWWTRLSFHDHPPFGFFVQNLFFNILGDSIWVARFPAVLFGTAFVFLIYLITRRLFSEAAGIAAAALTAVSAAAVWISRAALLEPTLLFLILLNIYFFLRFAQEISWRKKYWWLFGGVLGLVFLTKYTGIFIIPLYVVYIILFYRDMFRDWRTYATFFIAATLFTPVIIYNVMLFKTTGHFDLQIAYALEQDTPEWTGLLGKTGSRFNDLPSNWLPLFGMPLTLLSGFGFLHAIRTLRQQKHTGVVFLLSYLFFVTVLLITTGAADRFLILYLPALIMISAFGIATLWQYGRQQWQRYAFVLCIIALAGGEIVFMVQKNFIAYPDYGVAKLDQYFTQEFKGVISGAVPESENQHLTGVIRAYSKKQAAGEEKLYAIIYDDSVALSTLQWIFYRRFFYHSTPTFFVENWNEIQTSPVAQEQFKNFTLYFVEPTAHTLLNPFKRDKTAGVEFEALLVKKSLTPAQVITNKDGMSMFNVYKFTL